jgi:signal transduction histidine kinase
VKDLLPGASLRPATKTDTPIHLLAGIPVQLVPGAMPRPAASGLTPIQWSLATVWVCLAMFTLASVVLLRAMISLSERRAAFVSAVTHELRTPLTTFQMYTEMLKEGMVKDDHKQAEYFTTMHQEANRLSHLVENVLAYSRLDQGRADARLSTVSATGLIDAAKARLEQRVQTAKRGIRFTFAESADDAQIHTDVSVVEQILFNLVDNACKYGASESDGTVEVTVETAADGLQLRVRDHGPGISSAFKRKLFQPFSKSDREAADSAPGVGLGLSLCRRLARSIGGELALDSNVTDGACFVLTLPGRQ